MSAALFRFWAMPGRSHRGSLVAMPPNGFDQNFDDQFNHTQHMMHVWFTCVVILFIVIVVAGIVGGIWRVRAARSLADSSGINKDAATAAAMFDNNALSTLTVASRLGNQPAGQQDVAARLRQLDDLKAQGLITDAEHAEKRAAILKDL